AYVELRADLEAEKRKRQSRDKLLMRMWKEKKKLFSIIAPGSKLPKVSRSSPSSVGLAAKVLVAQALIAMK
ncbi:hypothetical protein HAX54_014729, partial [Datura stramonium]|nr:hypothetical protein [Datura stramonium]